jgi:DNA invertase Pin-like site-specific DNA recombinase
MIVERVRAGVARAKASGTKSGKAWKAWAKMDEVA